LRSSGVPQADKLERVLKYIRLLAAGKRSRLELAFRDRRDRAFYRAAARVLGLVEKGDVLTRLGRRIASEHDSECWGDLALAFEESSVGRAWLSWSDAKDVRELDPSSAGRFLDARAPFKSRGRRARTLSAWVHTFQEKLPPVVPSRTRVVAGGPSQLTFCGIGATGVAEPQVPWPSPQRFPHNEARASVRDVLWPELKDTRDAVIVAGYAALDEVIFLLSDRPFSRPGTIRLLIGSEPFASRLEHSGAPIGDLPAEIRDYWLRRGISITLAQPVLRVRELVMHRRVEVRASGSQRLVHAKLYATDTSVVIGSSNFTRPGLRTQTEANVRFTSSEGRRLEEARDLAEGLWTKGRDYTHQFLELLDALLKPVTWQEALGRACASLLEGEWAKRYVPPELIERLQPPLWLHQLQGISQAMWVLENVGSVLIADATGSGKTRMGAWVVRGAFDRLFRVGFVSQPSPLIVAPPQVVPLWESALQETGLSLQVHSHGPLSSSRAAKHESLLRFIENTELLAVDEAHNYLNPSARTLRLVGHYAEHALLFTATPINRSATDLLALIELLGADNFPDASMGVLMALRRKRHARDRDTPGRWNLIRREVRTFTVRRTRHQLNDIAESRPELYRIDSRQARYPRHEAKFYRCPSGALDLEIAREIAKAAEMLRGVTRIGRSLRIPPWLAASPESFLEFVRRSARGLARHHVMSSLRSSRAALLEHVLGTSAAVLEYLGPSGAVSSKAPTGNMAQRARDLAGNPPEWPDELASVTIEPWLRDPEAHAAACHEEAALYERIGALTRELTADRETAKCDHLAQLAADVALVLAFDAHVITLRVFEDRLRSGGLPVECLTGEGGIAAKRRAVQRLGLGSRVPELVALCSDAMSEGLNLQRASCVVHLDTPTVIRVAEQRAGRVDRMDSPHERIQIWWPRDEGAFAPQKRDILRDRHETVRDLIGANLSLPSDEGSGPEPDGVSDRSVERIEDVAARASIDAAEREFESARMYDAFRPVRDLVSGAAPLVEPGTYEKMRASQAEVVACVSAVESASPWAFLCVGWVDRAAPRWVFLESLDASPETDLARTAELLRARLGPRTRSAQRSGRTEALIEQFVSQLRKSELDLLPVRRRRAIGLLVKALDGWMQAARNAEDDSWARRLSEIRSWLCLTPADRAEPFPDPRAVADAWLRLIRPRVRQALAARRARRKLWRLGDVLPDLLEHPIPIEQMNATFHHVPALMPVEQRVLAMIVGVSE
jgi:hypothetical protein